jgi:hypothetical protein
MFQFDTIMIQNSFINFSDQVNNSSKISELMDSFSENISRGFEMTNETLAQNSLHLDCIFEELERNSITQTSLI